MLHNTTPLVTIITPTYNRADYLPEVIDSVLSQDYPNIEYIVLDDGSTDNTVEILRSYGDRLHWESHPNMGEANTVNKGWSMAPGEIVATVNSDDPILPGLVQASVEAMQANPDLLVVYPDWNMINEKSEVIQTIETYDYNYIDMLRWHHCVPGPGAFIRRRAFELEGMRDPQYKYVGDFEYWLRLGLHGPFARIPRELATFRFHASSASNAKKGTVMAQEHIRMMDKFFGRHDIPASAKKVKAEAYSAANYIAAVQCLDIRAEARKYFIKSILLHRNSFPNGLPRSWDLMFRTILPDKIYALVQRELKRLKR